MIYKQLITRWEKGGGKSDVKVNGGGVGRAAIVTNYERHSFKCSSLVCGRDQIFSISDSSQLYQCFSNDEILNCNNMSANCGNWKTEHF